jgi:hypothetical protein
MNPRLRSWAALGLTLVLGLGLGLLLGSRLAAHRFAKLSALSHPPMLISMIHETLDLDASQRAVLDSLLDAQAAQVSQRIQDHRQLMRNQMDSLLQALKPHLRDEQWTRLQDQLGRPPRRGPGRGFGPGGPDDLGPPPLHGGRREHRRGGPGGPPDSLDCPPPPPPDAD